MFSDTGCDYLIKLCKYSNYCNLASVNGFKVRGQVIVFTNFAEIHFLLLPLTLHFKPLLPDGPGLLLCLWAPASGRGNIVQFLHRDRQISWTVFIKIKTDLWGSTCSLRTFSRTGISFYFVQESKLEDFLIYCESGENIVIISLLWSKTKTWHNWAEHPDPETPCRDVSRDGGWAQSQPESRHPDWTRAWAR